MLYSRTFNTRSKIDYRTISIADLFEVRNVELNNVGWAVPSMNTVLSCCYD
jgi:hypothetical protein